MTFDTALQSEADVAAAVADEYRALADLLEVSDPAGMGRAVTVRGLAHPGGRGPHDDAACYSGPAFMAELEAAGGDFTLLSNTVAARDGALGAASLVSDLRAEALHGWQPPGGGAEGALTHCVIHGLDIIEAVPLDRRVPVERITRVLAIVARPGVPNPFGVDLSGVGLQADDLDWSFGSGAALTGSAQALAVVACGRLLPAGRLGGEAAARFTAAEGQAPRRELWDRRGGGPAPPGAPGDVPAGEVGRSGEAELAERRGGEARRIALGADHDDLLVVVPHLGQGVAPLQIEAPLEHIALHHDPEPELAFGGSLALGADVDHEGTAGAEPLELVWLDPVDLRSR